MKFSMKLCLVGDLERQLIAYVCTVLDALGVDNGPGHVQVKRCKDGPCLVEVGQCCHGGEGSWLPIVRECVGYTQVELNLFLSSESSR